MTDFKDPQEMARTIKHDVSVLSDRLMMNINKEICAKLEELGINQSDIDTPVRSSHKLEVTFKATEENKAVFEAITQHITTNIGKMIENA